jgi:16S rRNA (cytidine1402-2'-O)-methyltransferase
MINENGILYIVSTPIGNLADMTMRGKEILENVDFIAAEDTRSSGKLLKLLNIKYKKMISCFSGNEKSRVLDIYNLLNEGLNGALISDAGTPAISDPGETIVNELLDKGISIIPVPGVCAGISALSVSGMDSTHFYFEGFLPKRGSDRKKRLEFISRSNETIILYESPHRFLKTLKDLLNYCSENRILFIAREITKLYEEYKRCTIREAIDYYEEKGVKGEFTIILSKTEISENSSLPTLEIEIKRLISLNLQPKIISAILVKYYNISKREIYNLVVKLQ